MENILPVGIDVGSQELVVAFYGTDEIMKFGNKAGGHKALYKTIGKRMKDSGAERCRIAIEATGIYSLKLSMFLAAKEDVDLHVLNPAQARAYAQSKLSRTKTDESDARMLAELAAMHNDLPLWAMPSDLWLELKTLIGRRDSLMVRLTAIKNQGHALSFNPKPHRDVKLSQSRETKFLEKEIAAIEKSVGKLLNSNPEWSEAKKNLETIPGVGEVSSARILSVFGPDVSNLTAGKCTAMTGLDVSEFKSGTSINRKAHISKKGNAKLRATLYIAAMVGVRYNPILKEFYEKLLMKGKLKKVALIACEKKLVHIAFGVLKNRMPFDPNFDAIPA